MASTSAPGWLELLARPGLSRLMRRLVTSRAPRPVIRAATSIFSKVYDVELDQAERRPGEYETFQQFFTRRLKPGLRPVETDPARLPSPCDGRLTAVGPLGRGTLVQAKGIEYSLDALIGDPADADPYRGGSYAVIYLAPRDYHRVHVPCDGTLTHWRYLPGALYPVNSMGLRHVPGLFARNERLVGHLDSEFGKLAVVMVGATFVGHMKVAFADLTTNSGRAATGRVDLDTPLAMRRGEEFGVFEMGSTVILILDRDDVLPARPLGSAIRMGEAALRVEVAD